MTQPKFRTSREAKEAGWFSRRHETRDAHDAAREHYAATRGRASRQRRALEAKSREASPQTATPGSDRKEH